MSIRVWMLVCDVVPAVAGCMPIACLSLRNVFFLHIVPPMAVKLKGQDEDRRSLCVLTRLEAETSRLEI